MPCLKETTSNLKERDIRIEVESSSLDNTEDMEERENMNHQEITLQNDEESTDDNADSATLPIDKYQLTRDRQRRQIRPPSRFNDDNFVSFLTYQELVENEPLSYDEAMKSKDSLNWKAAMKKEMSSLMQNNTWILVEKPKNQKVVDCKWIYKIKEGEGSINNVRFKARLVAKGFTQREGVDYF
ncbi:putative mitochondrial protein [Abeliophyllum distichum]|uniref:Mitochondrial protein n=1 Tax=Abeliophyllum distichum TaxID=126358 RepID=A0ABD1R8M4_9LAMI